MHHTRALLGALALFGLLFQPLPISFLRLSMGLLHFLSLFGDCSAQLLLGAGSSSLLIG